MQRKGYLPQGPGSQPRIPPLPQFVVFEDRDDGTEWVLSHTDDEGTLRVTLNNQGLQRGDLAPRVDIYFIAGIDGLYMGQGIRLFVRGGRLGYDMIPYEVRSPTGYTRVGVVRETHEILVPDLWRRFPDELGWDEESGL